MCHTTVDQTILEFIQNLLEEIGEIGEQIGGAFLSHGSQQLPGLLRGNISNLAQEEHTGGSSGSRGLLPHMFIYITFSVSPQVHDTSEVILQYFINNINDDMQFILILEIPMYQ